MAVGPQSQFDLFKSDGGAQFSLAKKQYKNPPDSPFFPTANDYGCLGWTIDPADILTAAQTLTSQVFFGSMFLVPNDCTVSKLSLDFATVQGAQTNFNGTGLYSANAAGTLLTLLSGSATQTWTGVTPNAITDVSLTTPQAVKAGYYWAGILGSTSGTAATLHGLLASSSSAVNFVKGSGFATKYRSFTFSSALTALPATITLPGTVAASAFIPFVAAS